jgi:hypothetical protein
LGCGVVMLRLHCTVSFWVIELAGDGDGDGEGAKLDWADGFEAVSLLSFGGAKFP